MIIGFDASRAFISGKTGTENYSYQLFKALSKIDKKNNYIVYLRPNSVIASPAVAGRGNLDFQKNKDSHVTSFLGMTRENWPENFQFKVINWPRFWTQGGLALQTFRDKLDVLFVPSHTLPIIRKPGLKTVVTVHDLGSEYLPQMHQLKQRLYLSFMQKHQLKTATKIIAVSNATKQDLVKRMGLDLKKIEVIYEGYDKDLFKPVKPEILRNRLKYFDIKKDNYFLFVGTVQPRKNLESAISAFSQFLSLRAREARRGNLDFQKNKDSHVTSFLGMTTDSTNLVIAGSKGWLSDEIYALPKKLGIEDRVKFLGYVPDKDLPALYSGAIALVYPSLFEGFGLPILEAQACGCPVVTSNLSSMPEVAGEGAILVDPYNIEDIVKGMREIGEIGGIREKIIKAGLENGKRFSWEKCARETLRVLESLD